MASIDASGYAKSAAAMAAGVERLGRGMASLGSSITAADNKAKADQDSLELAHANSQYSIAKLDTAAGASPSGGSSAGSAAAPAASDPYNPSEEVDTAPVTGVPTPAGGQPTTQSDGALASPGATPTASSPDVSGATPAAPDQGLPQQEVHAPTSYARPLSANPDIEGKTNAFRAQRDQFAQGITDPLVRQKWVLNSEDDVERYRLGLMKQARSTERDNQITYARANQSAVISRAIETGDEGARAAGIRGQIDVVDALVANKFMTAQQGQAWKSQFRNDYGTAIGLASERKGPDAVNKTISELEQASFNAGQAQPTKPGVGPQSSLGLNQRRVAEINARPEVARVVEEAARRHGLDPDFAKVVVSIESGGRPGVKTGSYVGLFQLNPTEMQGGDPYDMAANADKGVQRLKSDISAFKQATGRDPTPTEIYMSHQQGRAGVVAHVNNPDQPAWKSMYSTGEGQQKGEGWAKKAIYWNIPDDVKPKFGLMPGRSATAEAHNQEAVDNVKSRDLMAIYNSKVSGGSSASAPAVSAATGEPVKVASADGSFMPGKDGGSQPWSRITLPKDQEAKFQSEFKGSDFYKEFVDKHGEPPNLDGDYDYRLLWKTNGLAATRNESDGLLHLPSKTSDGQWLKSPDHPTHWKEEFMQRTGKDPDAIGVKTPEEAATYGQQAQPQRHPTIFDAMDPLPLERLLKHMHGVRDVQQVKAAKDTSEGYERALIDASAGRGPLPSREAIQNEKAFNGNENIRNTLLKQYDSAAGDVIAIQNTRQRFRDGGQFNPYDKDERKNVDKIFGALGGEDPKQQAAALQSVITKTGIFPDSAAIKIRADLISNDPKRVVAGMTRASNALAGNPNILVKVDGEKDIEDNALKFRTYVDDFGMTAEEAANRLIRDQSPEYKASVNAKIKSEDVDDKIKKNLKINDLSGAFDDSFLGLATNPVAGYSVKARDKVFDQFGQLVKEYYLDSANGDWDMAKKLAANQLKKTWGISEINGNKMLTQYPPEKAPVYQGIENAPALIAQQAQEAIKTETGVDIDRKGIRMGIVPGVTAQQYKAGQPPAYLLSWEDKNGLVHMLNPGKAFVADPKALRDAQTAQREAAITAAVEARATNPMQDMGLEAKGRNAAADTLITSASERTAADVQKRQQLRDGMVY